MCACGCVHVCLCSCKVCLCLSLSAYLYLCVHLCQSDLEVCIWMTASGLCVSTFAWIVMSKVHIFIWKCNIAFGLPHQSSDSSLKCQPSCNVPPVHCVHICASPSVCTHAFLCLHIVFFKLMKSMQQFQITRTRTLVHNNSYNLPSSWAHKKLILFSEKRQLQRPAHKWFDGNLLRRPAYR